MKGSILGVALLAVVLGTGQVQAQELDLSKCAFPAAPAIPDGSTATEEQMADAGGAVRAFIGETEAGLACLESARTAHGGELTEEQQKAFNGTWDTAVDAMNAVANGYNQEVREYKAANPG